jgi:hypothetical protein
MVIGSAWAALSLSMRGRLFCFCQRQLIFPVVFHFWPIGVECLTAFKFNAVVDVVALQTNVDDISAIGFRL